MATTKRYQPRSLGDDPADVLKKVEARQAFLDRLAMDGRIQAAFLSWVDGAAGQGVVFRAWQWDIANLDFSRCDAPWESDLRDVGAVMLSSVPHIKNPPEWLTYWLGGIVIRWGYGALIGPVGPWRFQLKTPWASRHQRATKKDSVTGASTMRRDVGWFYRAEIAEPREGIRKLAREHLAGRAHSQSNAIVRDGIARAKKALEIN